MVATSWEGHKKMRHAKNKEHPATVLDPSRIPEALGWRRRPNLDEPSREAWELRDGSYLLLDPSGRRDALILPAHAVDRGERNRVAEPAGYEPTC
jgi:hypothetical protein